MPSEIRLACLTDAAAMQAIYAPFVLATPTSFEMTPPTVDDMAQRITKIQHQFPWLVFAQEASVVGYAYASTHRDRDAYQWATDVSVYLHADWRRRGIGRALYESLFAILRAQGYINVCAGITLPNPGSVALHEKMGLLPVGVYPQVGFKLGQWHDVGWWQGTLQPLPANPAPPQPISAITASQAWPTLLAHGNVWAR